MERMGQVAVCIVENVVTWDNVIMLMELARMVARSGTMVQNAWKVNILYFVSNMFYCATVEASAAYY